MSDRDLLDAAARAAVADTATPTGGEAPLTLSVGMLMEAGMMVGSTPDSVGTSNWAARMLRALRMLAANQRTAAALTQPEGGA